MTDTPIPRFLSTDESFKIAKFFQNEAAASGISAAVCGGLAMQLYGSDRNTKDIDFIAAAPLARSTKGKLSFGGDIYEDGGVPVDWIVRVDDQRGLYEAALESRVRVHGLYTVTPNYLALIKLLARRPKDESDLIFLLRSGKVDRKHVERLAQALYGTAAFIAIDDFSSYCAEADLQDERDRRRPNPRILNAPKRLVIHAVKGKSRK